MEYLPLVSIICTAYNHETFIKDALESFIMQKTNFQFEIIVSDDASTDMTASIIKQYEINHTQLFKTFYHKENQYSRNIPFFYDELIKNARGKYIAICEGDDYWTDPLKLQRQVDFLEKNTNYGLVYTQAKVYQERNHKFLSILIGENVEGFENLILKNTIPTLTVLFRSEILNQYNMFIASLNDLNLEMGDYQLWLYISAITQIKFLPFSTAVYRLNEESVSQSKNPQKTLDFLKSTFEIQKYFIKKFGVSNRIYQIIENNYFKTSIYYALLAKETESIEKAKFHIKKQKLRLPLIFIFLIQVFIKSNLISWQFNKLLLNSWSSKL